MSNEPAELVSVVLIIPAQFGFPCPPWNVRRPFLHDPCPEIGALAAQSIVEKS